MNKTIFKVANMKCNGCSANVEKALAEVLGIESVEVDLEGKTVAVVGKIDPQTIISTINKAGYPTELS